MTEKVKDDIVDSSPTDDISDSSTEDKKFVPYERFKEVNDKLKEVTGTIKELQAQKASGGLSADQQKELEAQQYLKKIILNTQEEVAREKQQKELQDKTEFNEQVKEQLDLNPDVKKADFLKFIEKDADSYGVKSVSGAMALYKKFSEVEKNASDKTKKDIAGKPKMPSHEGGGKDSHDDKGKSLYQITAEAIKENSKK